VAEANGSDSRGLVLLIDNDVESRRHVRRLLEQQGMDVVQASNGIAALELIQRLPQSFRLVITELELPGLSGAILAETLRLFRPELRTLCMSSHAAAIAAGRQCLSKPVAVDALQAAMLDGHATQDANDLPEVWIARARARYALMGDLVEAALELSRAAGAEDGGG